MKLWQKILGYLGIKLANKASQELPTTQVPPEYIKAKEVREQLAKDGDWSVTELGAVEPIVLACHFPPIEEKGTVFAEEQYFSILKHVMQNCELTPGMYGRFTQHVKANTKSHPIKRAIQAYEKHGIPSVVILHETSERTVQTRLALLELFKKALQNRILVTFVQYHYEADDYPQMYRKYYAIYDDYKK